LFDLDPEEKKLKWQKANGKIQMVSDLPLEILLRLAVLPLPLVVATAFDNIVRTP
jgi:hypothetical protein